MNSFINKEIGCELEDVEGVLLNDILHIREPVGIDGIIITLKRDEEYFGVNYEFSDADTMLQFGGQKKGQVDTGRDLLETVYQSKGADGLVILRIKEFVRGGTDILIYEGNVNFKTYSRDKRTGIIRLRVKRITFEEKLRTRFDTPISLNAVEDLDGNTITAIAEFDLVLDSYQIQKVNSASIVNPKLNEGIPTEMTDGWKTFNSPPQANSWLPIWDNIITQELGQIFNYRVNIRGLPQTGAGNPDDDIDNLTLPGDFGKIIEQAHFYLFKNEAANNEIIQGDFALNLDFDIEVRRQSVGSETVSIVEAQARLVIGEFDPDDADTFIMRDSLTVDSQDDTGLSIAYTETTIASHNITLVGTSTDVSLRPNEQLYLVIAFRVDATGISNELRISANASSFSYTAGTLQQPTQEKGVYWFEAMNKAIEIATGQSTLVSPLLDRIDNGASVDGDFYNNMLVNGYRTRHALQSDGTTDRPIETSIKDMMEFLQFQMWAGYGIENNVVAIRRGSEFFADKEIVNLTDIYDLKIEVADDMIYNETNFKYKKIIDESFNSLLDVHTEQSKLLPITQIKRKYNQSSSIFLSSYIIEHTRRQQFNEEQTSSWKYDDDLMNVCVVKKSVYTDIARIKGNINEGYIDFKQIATGQAIPLFLFEASGFTIAGTTNYNGDYTVGRSLYVLDDEDEFATRVWTVEAVPSITAETSVADITFDTVKRVPEHAENFTTLNGYYSKETAYNLRHNLLDAFLNHLPILGSSLHHKANTDVIKTTFTKNNQDFERKFASGEDYSTLDPSLQTLDYLEDITKGNLNGGRHLFIPEWITFKTRMNYTQFNRIRDALKNQSTEDINYGYISVYDNENDTTMSGFPWEVAKNPLSEEVSFKLLRKSFQISIGGLAQVGNSLVITGAGETQIAALSATRISLMDVLNAELRTYDFDGTDWAQVGNSLAYGADITMTITKLSSTRIAIWGTFTNDLRTYDFDGTDWAQVGNDLNILLTDVAISGLSSSRIALAENGGNTLRTYDFNGTDWAQVGNSLSITSAGVASLAGMSTNRVAYLDGSNIELRTYDFNGTDWAQVGSGLSIADSPSSASIAAMTSSRIAYFDGTNSELRIYDFDGSSWVRSSILLDLLPSTQTGVNLLTSMDSTTLAIILRSGSVRSLATLGI